MVIVDHHKTDPPSSTVPTVADTTPRVVVTGALRSRGVGGGRDALEGKGPQRRPQKWLGSGLEEVAKADVGGYCRLQMPLTLAFAVMGTVAGRRTGALERGGVPPPPSNAFLGGGGVKQCKCTKGPTTTFT